MIVTDCLFCAIAAGSIPAAVVWESDDIVAFKDVNPQAPVHILVIPRRHFRDTAALAAADPTLAAALMSAACDVARASGLEGGYRLVLNTGRDGGQSVGHVHVHVLGGRRMLWPPG